MAKAKYEKDIQDLLNQADDELKYIHWDLKGGFYRPVCFWSQQVAEKSLKAGWLFYEKKPIKIHDLRILAKELESKLAPIKDMRKEILFLNQFYVATRYPNGGFEKEIGISEAKKALRTAEKVNLVIKTELDYRH